MKSQFGIDDYTEEFSQTKATINDDVFGDLANQDRAVRRFVDALSAPQHAILNFGDAGVGKTTAVKGLITALEALNKGEEVKGKYAPEVTAFHERLRHKERGDVLALWNPTDYNAPILFRPNAAQQTAKTLSDEVEQAMDDLHVGGNVIIRETLLAEHSLMFLRRNFHSFVQQNGLKYEQIEWSFNEKPGSADILNLSVDVHPAKPKRMSQAAKQEYEARRQELKNELATLLIDAFEDSTATFTREEASATFQQLLNHPPVYFREIGKHLEQFRDRQRQALEAKIDGCIATLQENSQKWSGKEPIVAQWYKDAVAYLAEPERRASILKSFQETEKNAVKALVKWMHNKEEVMFSPSDHALHMYSVRFKIDGKEFAMTELLKPGECYIQDGARGVTIREMNLFDPSQLFMDVDTSGTVPLHLGVELGPLAYADLVTIDDAFGDIVTEKATRRALLTFLQDGDIRITYEKTQIRFKNECFLLVNETQNPFERQKFQNTDPEFDEGMYRRFSVVPWSSHTEANKETRATFPMILKRASLASKNGDPETGFTPEAMNLIWQYQLAMNEPSMHISTQIGLISKELFQPLIRYAKRHGASIVTPDHVIDYLWSLRVHEDERYITSLNLAQEGVNSESWKIGEAHGMAVYQGHPNDFGGVTRVNVFLQRRLGQTSSNDTRSQMTDETFLKGVYNADSWLQTVFGPYTLEMEVSMTGYGGISGPSGSGIMTYAMMSALGDIPVAQNVFVTGTQLDREGNVGIIGGVYEKTRGAYLFAKALKEQSGFGHDHVGVLVPKGNAREFLRRALFDRELMKAMDDGALRVYHHDTIWDGFEVMSGKPREIYEPAIRANIAKLQHDAAMHEYLTHNAMKPPGRGLIETFASIFKR